MKKFFMNKTVRTSVLLLAVSALTATLVLAASGTKNIEVQYDNIKVFVNGSEIDSTGANEPFVIDGSTYLPVRNISELTGSKVEWDGSTKSVYVGANPSKADEMFAAAVNDSMTIEDDELFDLVEISESSKMCTWDDQGRVLMLTHHSYPDSYVEGEDYTLTYGEVWTFTDREIVEWYKENSNSVEDWELRFKQLIGLQPGRTYTHFSAMWVNPEDITRPGYAWQLKDTRSAKDFTAEPSEEFKAWFDSNIIWSYFESDYPWTRLGYTYDWSAGSGEYGLSEFLIRKDAVTHVEFTLTIDEFLDWLSEQAGENADAA